MLTVHTQATQAAHVAEEWVDQAFRDLKEQESKRFAAQKSQAMTNKKLNEALLKLAECDKARKSDEASIESLERQAWEQLVQLREAESQLSITRTTITELKKELGKKDKEIERVERIAYDQGQKETEAHLKSQLFIVCHSFCLQTWIEALNAVRVDSNSKLRNLEKAFYLLAIRARPANQPSINTLASTPVGSIENPQPKSNTAAPAQAKSIEQQPKTTTLTKAKSTEQQPISIAPAKPKQIELAISKPSTFTTQSTEVVTKAPPTAGDSSTIAPTNHCGSFCPNFNC